jgi:hypothetical protein
MYVYSEDSDNIKVIKDYFDKWDGSLIENVDNESFEVYFDSKWVFPEEKMIELFKSIPNKEDIYMRCLSVEYGMYYHELWICDDEYGWKSV